MNITLLIAIGIAVFSVGMAALSIFQAWNIYRHPYLNPYPVSNTKMITGSGFKWINLENVSNIVPAPVRSGDGAFWRGASFGISKETGKAAQIVIVLYGAERGVGHYTWAARTNMFNFEKGAGGHFNMDNLWRSEFVEHRVMQFGIDSASSGVSEYFRPLNFEHDDRTGRVSDMYDPISGQLVFGNSNRESATDDLYVLGPPPVEDDSIPDRYQPGAYLQPLIPDEKWSPGHNEVRFVVGDVYGGFIKDVLIAISSESDWRYKLIITAEENNGVWISVPSELRSLQLEITRKGFHTVDSHIEVGEGRQSVHVYMEPVRHMWRSDGVLWYPGM